MTAVGDLIDVDDDFEELTQLDRARVLIRTPWRPRLQHTVVVTIDGAEHHIAIVEEGAVNGGTQNRRANSESIMSEDVQSEDIDIDSVGAAPSINLDFFNSPKGTAGEGGDGGEENALYGPLTESPFLVKSPTGIVQQKVEIIPRPQQCTRPKKTPTTICRDDRRYTKEGSRREQKEDVRDREC